MALRTVWFGLICILLTVAEGVKAAPTPSANAAQDTSRGTEARPLIVRGELIVNRSAEAASQEASDGKAKMQLDADMVRYTGLNVAVTAVMCFTALMQAGLFVWQLSMMRKTAKDGQLAAIAAMKNVEIAERTLIASRRPWLAIRKVELGTPALEWTPGGVGIAVNVTVENVGGGPAFDVEIAMDAHVSRHGMFGAGEALGQFADQVRADVTAPREAWELHVRRPITYPKEQAVQYFTHTIPRTEIDGAVLTPQQRVIMPVIYLCVDYKDSLSQQRHRTTAVYLLLMPPKSGTPNPDPGIPLDENLIFKELSLAPLHMYGGSD